MKPQKMDKKSKNKNNSNVTTEDKLNRLKDSIKGTLTRNFRKLGNHSAGHRRYKSTDRDNRGRSQTFNVFFLKNSENVNINLNDNGKNSIRLPQIPLPEFSGVIAEFSNFKNQFINLISNNEQLNDSQKKLYYLRASLKGEAKLLESPSDSFDSLFKALEDRYENKRQLIDSHVLR
ncbi:uncharacterized protein TNCV_1879331 [Trichonephila clavipes]|nr:uncharacterized protein TNCV_1879331 [Trichonephila clavipes]